ncbi:MAG: hypothetical protein ACYC35_19945 [Pirellulales bacterium]
MNLKQLSRQLRRELTANPKKAAVLGLLMVVALYFWGPLVWKWTHSGSAAVAATGPSATPAEAGLAPGNAAVTNAAATNSSEAKPVSRRPWQELVAWMEGDVRMRPADAATVGRNPFDVSKISLAVEAQRKNESKEPPKSEVTPQSVGLVVSSTVVGTARSTAVINGKAYERGREIKISKDGQDVAFVLTEVHPRRVVLAREGKQFELAIVRPKTGGRIDLRGKRD